MTRRGILVVFEMQNLRARSRSAASTESQSRIFRCLSFSLSIGALGPAFTFLDNGKVGTNWSHVQVIFALIQKRRRYAHTSFSLRYLYQISNVSQSRIKCFIEPFSRLTWNICNLAAVKPFFLSEQSATDRMGRAHRLPTKDPSIHLDDALLTYSS